MVSDPENLSPWDARDLRHAIPNLPEIMTWEHQGKRSVGIMHLHPDLRECRWF